MKSIVILNGLSIQGSVATDFTGRHDDPDIPIFIYTY